MSRREGPVSEFFANICNSCSNFSNRVCRVEIQPLEMSVQH